MAKKHLKSLQNNLKYKPLIYEGVAAVYMYKDNWPYQLANK